MKNFHCKKCNLLLESDKTPNTTGCTSNSSHQWVDLGYVGSKNFHCKRCNLLVKSDKTPNTTGCTSNSSHQWGEL